MPSSPNPAAPIQLIREQARRYLLVHQRLLPPRQLMDKAGILDFVEHVGCIQFDPVNIVGRNPDLVLQARIANYQSTLLEEALYQDHLLMDGWDKLASIHLTRDWPYFERHRQRMADLNSDRSRPEITLADEILRQMRLQGEYDPSQSKSRETIVWNWGRPVRMERAALEVLYANGEVGISRRVGSRRIYNLIEHLVPPEVLATQDPNQTLDDYHDWHVLRRIGSVGLVQSGSSDFWLGIQHAKAPQRAAAIARLLAKGDLVQLEIKELPGKVFYMRTADLPKLEEAGTLDIPEPQTAFLPPLDNLLWDRKLLSWLFEFDYTWEAYKKPQDRQYGHYTLPVLYGDRFIARFDPSFDRKSKRLTINNWWWESDVKPNRPMRKSLRNGMLQFMQYLNASSVVPGPDIDASRELAWLEKL
jgi:uncharacterized protein YcaQ